MIGITAAIFVWIVGATCVGIAVAVLLHRSRTSQTQTKIDGDPDDIAFLFLRGKLVDATDLARKQLPKEPAGTDDLGRFTIAFGQRFGGLSSALATLRDGEQTRIAEVPDDPGSQQLVATLENERLHVRLEDPLRDERDEKLTAYSLAAMRAELFTLRAIAERAPVPTWKRRNDGCIVWANSQYVTLAREIAGEAALLGWPPPDLFEAVEGAAARTPEKPMRVSLTRSDCETDERTPIWFDLVAIPGEIETLFFAMPIDKLVRAETALKEFVDTLTETFAHLRIGLAVFDSRRKLVLFNPALVDLTGLRADQLSGRPTLHAFLDALRDAQRIPEPKDYKSWRMHMAELEAGAEDGTTEETWHLPNGQTFRVSGRPHPDGAVAFLFEDISDKMSETRRARARLDLDQSVFDALEIAIATFSADGRLVLSNAAYDAMWAPLTARRPARELLQDAAALWATRCRDEAAEAGLEQFAYGRRRGGSWSDDLRLADGSLVTCRLQTVSGGALLATFSPKLPETARAPLEESRLLA